MMVAGGVGALLSTAPLAAALTLLSWRGIFVVLAVATFASALCILWVVPDTPLHSRVTGWKYQWAGVKRVFGSARFWWVAPLCAVATGSFMAIQGLWSVPWLMEVDGYSRMVAADHLLVLGIVILGGYLGLGFFATTLRRLGIGARHLLAAGFGLNILMLALIVTQALSSNTGCGALGLGSAASPVHVLGEVFLGTGWTRPHGSICGCSQQFSRPMGIGVASLGAATLERRSGGCGSRSHCLPPMCSRSPVLWAAGAACCRAPPARVVA